VGNADEASTEMGIAGDAPLRPSPPGHLSGLPLLPAAGAPCSSSTVQQLPPSVAWQPDLPSERFVD